jgi:enamine deaminase RidA (YjgF/YER057c/UK114 family)
MNRINIRSDSPWEDIVGYSRAVIHGDMIEISGTTAYENGVVIGKGDPFRQTIFILEKIKKVLETNGSCMNDVVRTRIYVTDIQDWEKVGKAHGLFFSEIKPAATMIEVQSLIDPGLLVEIEVTARINAHE